MTGSWSETSRARQLVNTPLRVKKALTYDRLKDRSVIGIEIIIYYHPTVLSEQTILEQKIGDAALEQTGE